MIQGVSSLTRAAYSEAYASTAKASHNTESVKSTNDISVIYEPSNVLYKTHDSSVTAKSKAIGTKNINQNENLVTHMSKQRGYTLAGADKMWKFLSNGKAVAEEAAITQTFINI